MANLITDIGGDNRIAMSNARFARPLPAAFLSGWSKIRVALLVTATDPGVNLTGTPRFGVGLCSGNANILGDATTTHFVGFMSNTASWTRATTPLRLTIAEGRAAVHVGSTLTLAAADALANWVLHTDGTRHLYFVDITKGSPNFTIQLSQYVASAGVATTTDAIFLTQSALVTPNEANHTAGTAQTMAVDEGTNGTLDHVNVWFNQSASVMHLAHLRVYRVA